MEITVPHFFVDSDDDSSSGTASPVPLTGLTGARIHSTDPLPEWQCKYTGKICPHARARKTNGKLHRLCDEHRVRANVNQRRLQQKRREARAQKGLSPYPLSPAKAVAVDESIDQNWDDWFAQVIKDDVSLDHEPLAIEALTALAAAPPTTATTTTEPLTAPCDLLDEDVEALTLLFTSNISTDSTDNEIYDVMYGAIYPTTS